MLVSRGRAGDVKIELKGRSNIMAEPTWRIILFSLVASAMLSQKGKARLKKVERPPPFSNSLCLLTSANTSR